MHKVSEQCLQPQVYSFAVDDVDQQVTIVSARNKQFRYDRNLRMLNLKLPLKKNKLT